MVIRIRVRVARLGSDWNLDNDTARALNISVKALALGGRRAALSRPPMGRG